jgi:hypothetical protein
MNENTARKEQNIPQQLPLDEAVAAIKNDAQNTPEEYLKDSIVPKGGE